MRILIGICFLLLSGFVSAIENDRSVFQASIQGVDQTGATASLEQARGNYQVVAFVYTSCTSMCPIILADLKHLDATLNARQKQHTKITLISLDPEHDTPAVMQTLLQKQKADQRRWRFLQLPPEQLQMAAMLFNIRVRDSGGEIAHSNVISLLDMEGNIVYQRQGNEPVTVLLNKIPQ